MWWTASFGVAFPTMPLFGVVFSAFGYVHKIATFEKASGYQALIQFSDAETATSAKAALDGRCIPSYLLPELDGACTLRITYSAHTVLNVKFQSHRSRTLAIMQLLNYSASSKCHAYVPTYKNTSTGMLSFSMKAQQTQEDP